MDWVMIGTIATIIGVIMIPVIFASIRFGKSIGKMENEIEELRNKVQPIYSHFFEVGLGRVTGHQSESYLISERGEAVIPDESKKQIQTFIKQRKDLLDKSLDEITFAASSSAVDLTRTLNGIRNKLPKEIDSPTEFAFGIFTAYVGYVAAETLKEEADELFAKGDKEKTIPRKARSKIAKAANLYEEIGEIKKAADIHKQLLLTEKGESLLTEEMKEKIKMEIIEERAWVDKIFISTSPNFLPSISKATLVKDLSDKIKERAEEKNEDINTIIDAVSLYADKITEIQSLRAALKDKNKDVRRKAAGDLGGIGDAEVVEPLIEALKDKDEPVRFTAAKSLGKIGAEAVEAVEPLIEALTNKRLFVRDSAALALGIIGSAKAIGPLQKAMARQQIGSTSFWTKALKGEGSPTRKIVRDALNKIEAKQKSK